MHPGVKGPVLQSVTTHGTAFHGTTHLRCSSSVPAGTSLIATHCPRPSGEGCDGPRGRSMSTEGAFEEAGGRAGWGTSKALRDRDRGGGCSPSPRGDKRLAEGQELEHCQVRSLPRSTVPDSLMVSVVSAVNVMSAISPEVKNRFFLKWGCRLPHLFGIPKSPQSVEPHHLPVYHLPYFLTSGCTMWMIS